MFNDYLSYEQMGLIMFVILIVVGIVIYYFAVIAKFNKRMKAHKILTDRLTALLDLEAELNEELFYCVLESRITEIESALLAIDVEWKEIMSKLNGQNMETK